MAKHHNAKHGERRHVLSAVASESSMTGQDHTMRPIIITGAAGLVGSALVRAGGRAYSRAQLDICDPDAIARMLEKERPRAVVNAAAVARLDAAEGDPERAFAVNAHAVDGLARRCAQAGVRLVHLSTDYVLDAPDTMRLHEDLPPMPRSVYAHSKQQGEAAALAQGGVVVRVQWVYHPGHPSFFTTALRRALRGECVQLVEDQVGVPTWAGELAPALLRCAQMEAGGLYHLAAQGECSPATWIATAAQMLGLALRSELISRNRFAGIYRPSRSCLSSERFESVFGVGLAPWSVGLRRALKAVDRGWLEDT